MLETGLLYGALAVLSSVEKVGLEHRAPPASVRSAGIKAPPPPAQLFLSGRLMWEAQPLQQVDLAI